jgi:enoyl-[acyl-carrier protein] reductase I
MIDYSSKFAPLADPLTSGEVGATAAFLSSNLASGITAATIYVDKGMHSMALAPQE